MEARFDIIPYGDLSPESSWTRLGKGSFGCVYKGEYLGLQVAIKEVLESNEYDVEKYFQRECKIMQECRHPNIVQYIGLCLAPPAPPSFIPPLPFQKNAATSSFSAPSSKSPGQQQHPNRKRILIISEYLPGGNLRTCIASNRLEMPWTLRMSFAVDTARAVAYLHARRCLHRDLKGENLLITENGRIKVCDFGFARIAARNEEEMRRMSYCGTDGYMSPEILLGMEFGLETDIFSLGVIFCEILSRRLVDADTFKREMPSFGVDAQEISLLASPGCPPAFVSLAVQCVAVNPAHRPSIRRILEELRKIEREVVEAEERQGRNYHVGSMSFGARGKGGKGKQRPALPNRIPSFEGKVKVPGPTEEEEKERKTVKGGNGNRFSISSSSDGDGSDDSDGINEALVALGDVKVGNGGVALGGGVRRNRRREDSLGAGRMGDIKGSSIFMDANENEATEEPLIMRESTPSGITSHSSANYSTSVIRAAKTGTPRGSAFRFQEHEAQASATGATEGAYGGSTLRESNMTVRASGSDGSDGTEGSKATLLKEKEGAGREAMRAADNRGPKRRPWDEISESDSLPSIPSSWRQSPGHPEEASITISEQLDYEREHESVTHHADVDERRKAEEDRIDEHEESLDSAPDSEGPQTPGDLSLSGSPIKDEGDVSFGIDIALAESDAGDTLKAVAAFGDHPSRIGSVHSFLTAYTSTPSIAGATVDGDLEDDADQGGSFLHRFTLVKPGWRSLYQPIPYIHSVGLSSTGSEASARRSSGEGGAFSGLRRPSSSDRSRSSSETSIASSNVGIGLLAKCLFCEKRLGLMKPYLTCDDCGYTCHVKCGDIVPRNCGMGISPVAPTPSSTSSRAPDSKIDEPAGKLKKKEKEKTSKLAKKSNQAPKGGVPVCA